MIHQLNMQGKDKVQVAIDRCVGCPMNTKNGEELEKYPKFKKAYIRAFDRMLKEYAKPPKKGWKTGEDVYKWWVSGGMVND